MRRRAPRCVRPGAACGSPGAEDLGRLEGGGDRAALLDRAGRLVQTGAQGEVGGGAGGGVKGIDDVDAGAVEGGEKRGEAG